MPTMVPDKAPVILLPPLIVVAAHASASFLHFIRPIRFASFHRKNDRWQGALLTIDSIPTVMDGLRQLDCAKTMFDDQKPTRAIITGGVFRLSRNPTFLSRMLFFLGIAAVMDALWLLYLALPFVVILQRGIIKPEERYLDQKFGETFLRYKP
jgi:protein-S-isoprenylcysteine O-methyltransferase Ste14